MIPLRKFFTTSLLVGTLAVSAVACGSDSDSGSDDAITPSSVSVSSSVSDSVTVSDSVAVTVSDSDSDEATSAWCEKFQEYNETDDDLEDADFVVMIETLAKDAPSEIRDDMQYLESAFKDGMAAMETGDSVALAELDEEKFDATIERIEVYVKDVCGYDLDAD